MNRDIQRIIDSDEYKQIFPRTQLFGKNIRSMADGSYLRNNDIFEIVGFNGKYRSAGVGSGITGQGFNIGIVDDPIKDMADAMSERVRESTWDWFRSTFMTRAAPDAAVVVMATRWHKDDLIGKILQSEDADQWVVLKLPAIATEERGPYDPREVGEALWPSRYPIEALQAIKRSLGTFVFSALYQQDPIPLEGRIFKREWITPEHFVKKAPKGLTGLWYWDNAGSQGKGKRSAGVLIGKHEGRIYIMMCVAGQWSPNNREVVKKQCAEWGRASYGINTVWTEQEPGSAGVESAHATITNLSGFVAKAGTATGDKVTRSLPFCAQAEAGNVYIVQGDWNEEYLSELDAFPRGSFKDRMDATSGAFNKLMGKRKIIVSS